MKKELTIYFHFLWMLLFLVRGYGQTDRIIGEIATVDTGIIKILNIYPDSFPGVSVVFKAETQTGEPFWNLSKSDLLVTENSEKCEVTSLTQISKVKPINIAIVVDHSGSMLYDYSLYFQAPGSYVPPIHNAKEAVLSFVSSFDFDKDYISIIGFSTRVTERLPLTKDIATINETVGKMIADSSTALYDAIVAGTEELSQAEGVNVVVALTDGHDNSSTVEWSNFIKSVRRSEVPVYVVGLGNANSDSLKIVCSSSNGKYYYTKSSGSLDSIYTQISQEIQAFYDLKYDSPNLSSIDTVREIELAFDIDSLYQIADSRTMSLPEEVIRYLGEKEETERTLFVGGIVLASLLLAGILFYSFTRSRASLLKIQNIYPNPSTGIVTLEGNNLKGEVRITNNSGQLVKSFELIEGEKSIDLSELSNGSYYISILDDNKLSKAVPIVIRK